MALVMPKKAWGFLLPLGIAFHVGIAVVHGLVSFGFAMIAALVLYLRPTDEPFALPAFDRPSVSMLKSRTVASDCVAAQSE